MNDLYGVGKRTEVADAIDQAAEEIALQGYAVLPPLFPADSLPSWRQKLDAVYARQEAEFGREALADIGELDLCRAPLLYDRDFLTLAMHPTVLAVARRMLGDWIVLHLQNGIINRPARRHHQASWHRDLPHQNWVITKPLAISAIVAIDDFSAVTGGTRLLPFTHKNETMPSKSYTERHAVDAQAPAGSVIMFDSMLFHQAGDNRSANVRRAMNHVYSSPIIKQQYDFPRALAAGGDLPADTAKLLGFTSQVPLDDRAWRKSRVQKLSQS